jgi:hypothetical protein
MAVLVFQAEPTVYHYPRHDHQKRGEATRCGLKAAKTAPPVIVDDALPTNWQPCDKCSELDDHEQRFVGTW